MSPMPFFLPLVARVFSHVSVFIAPFPRVLPAPLSGASSLASSTTTRNPSELPNFIRPSIIPAANLVEVSGLYLDISRMKLTPFTATWASLPGEAFVRSTSPSGEIISMSYTSAKEVCSPSGSMMPTG